MHVYIIFIYTHREYFVPANNFLDYAPGFQDTLLICAVAYQVWCIQRHRGLRELKSCPALSSTVWAFQKKTWHTATKGINSFDDMEVLGTAKWRRCGQELDVSENGWRSPQWWQCFFMIQGNFRGLFSDAFRQSQIDIGQNLWVKLSSMKDAEIPDEPI